MLPDGPDPLIGSMLGKDYRVLEQIGVGGMAVVYLVEHQTLLKQFAAKVLSPALASSLEARARFTQEAHAASQLDHENIVSISDFGVTIDHRPFFIMELLRGKTLDQRLAEGRMTIEEVVAVSVPVARALSHAHAEGIIHLDVKPENIFLVQRSQGRWGVKVVDFGIAKTPLNPRLTKIGETNGSPLFMAPEMCRGDDDVDQRADVYSFGILLYLMMCGRLPFVDASLHRVLQMQLIQLPPPPRQVNSELSPELAAIVERALAKQREDRYPSMEALLIDLAAALPDGSDRLLIEAQSGVTSRGAPFSGPASTARTDSQRAPRLPARPMFQSMLPQAPKRTRPAVLATAVVLVVAAGALAWRQLATGPSAPRRASAASVAPASSTVAAAVSPSSTAEVASAPATATPEPTAPPTAAEPASTEAGQAAVAVASDEPASAPSPARRATLDRPIASAKKPVLRSKPVVRPGPPRPAKRGAVLAAMAAPAGAGSSGAEPPAARSVEASAAAEVPAAEVAASDANATRDPEVAGSAAAPIASPPRPAPPAIAAPVKPAPAPVAAAGSLDAMPELIGLEVKGPLSKAIVRRSIERTLSSLRACYRAAARAGKSTPALELRLSFEIDENSLATQVVPSGASFGSLPTCAGTVASQIRTQEAPDTGTAQVTAVIRFRPL